MTTGNQSLLSTDLLSEYINTFYGYGDWGRAKFWFVGIEEGGGNEIENIQSRLNSWVKLGKTELLDCYEHHCNMGSFTDANQGKLHTQTWTKLIITKLNTANSDFSTSSILNIQLKDWGSLKSDNLLIELLPLPSPGIGTWSYRDKGWVDLKSSLSFLQDRVSYESEVTPKRVEHIKARIAEHKPKVVLFYGSSKKRYWNQIADMTNVSPTCIFKKYKIRHLKQDGTLFIQCPQPKYVWAYDFWVNLGKEIALILEKD